MKKIISVLILSLFLTSCSSLSSIYPKNDSIVVSEPVSTATPNTVDFRSNTWGESIQNVEKIEGVPIEKSQGFLAYDGSLLTYPVMIAYRFNDDKLYRGMYVFNQAHVDAKAFITDFKMIEEELINKYGKPSEQFETWTDDLYKDDPSDWGMAIKVGDLTYISTWEIQETEIVLILAGDNFEASLFLEYTDTSEEKNVKKDTSGL